MTQILGPILAALITGLCAVVGNMLIARQANSELYAKLDKQSALADEKLRGEISVIEAEISELRTETRKHNSVIERTYLLEQQSAVHTEQIEDTKRRVHDLEKKTG